MSGLPWEILQGDVRKVLKTLPSTSFDAVLSDPPYGLQFMGKRWDYDVPSVNVWTELLRVVKPGAQVMLFGGSRTFHRLVVNVEDAGFEIDDVCLWLYFSGYAKPHDTSKAIDKANGHWRGRAGKVVSQNVAMGGPNYERTEKGDPITAAAAAWKGYGANLKPAYEPILKARRPPGGSVANNVAAWWTGAINIDASRVGQRWPANVVVSHATHCVETSSGWACVVGCPARIIDMESAARRGTDDPPSRFFYSPKADPFERECGLDGMKPEIVVRSAKDGPWSPRSRELRANTHTTVKPVDLIRYYAKMILPPKGGRPRRILVPFSGSGSEIIGCLQAGWDEVVGIERESEYIAIAKERITKGGVHSTLADRSYRTKREGETRPAGRRVYGRFARDK